MDWRLFAALASFSGSLGLVVVVAIPFFSTQPAQPKKVPSTTAATTLPQRSAPAGRNVAPIGTTAASRKPSPTEYNPLISPVLGQRQAALTPISLNPPADSGVETQASPAADIANASTAIPYANSNTAIPYVEPETPKLTVPPSVKQQPAFGPRVAPAVKEEHYQGVLTEAEIARIRFALRLTPDQVPLWPPVHSMLSEMGRQQLAQIKNGQKPQLQAADWPAPKLYGAAGPLLKSLRPDQKDQVRDLCRSLGFQMVASMI